MALAPRRLARQAETISIGVNDCVEVSYIDPDSVEFFLDEDSEVAHGHITIRVAGTLAFVPGPDYRWPTEGRRP